MTARVVTGGSVIVMLKDKHTGGGGERGERGNLLG